MANGAVGVPVIDRQNEEIRVMREHQVVNDEIVQRLVARLEEVEKRPVAVVSAADDADITLINNYFEPRMDHLTSEELVKVATKEIRLTPHALFPLVYLSQNAPHNRSIKIVSPTSADKKIHELKVIIGGKWKNRSALVVMREVRKLMYAFALTFVGSIPRLPGLKRTLDENQNDDGEIPRYTETAIVSLMDFEAKN